MNICLVITFLLFVLFQSEADVLNHSQDFVHISFPKKFVMKEKIVTLGIDYILQENDSEFGVVQQKITFLKKVFELKNRDNQVISTAEQVLYFGWRKFNVIDSNGNKLGSIVYKPSFSFLKVKYQIKDAADQTVGTVEYKSFLGKIYITVWRSDGKEEAYFENRLFSLFRMRIDAELKGGTIDRRLLLFLPSIVIIKE